MNILKDVRNIGIMAHIDAGKTTTTERILYYSGRLHKMGEVHEGAATMDWMEQEQERGITITSAATTVFWKGMQRSTSSTRRATSTSPSKWSVRCAFSMALSPFSMPFPAWSRSPKRSGAKPTNMAFPVLPSSTRWTGSAPTIFEAIKSMREKLHANAIAVHCPIGAESEFKGMVDLVTMRALFFHDETLGADWEETDIPADLLEQCKEMRAELFEELATIDEDQ